MGLGNKYIVAPKYSMRWSIPDEFNSFVWGDIPQFVITRISETYRDHPALEELRLPIYFSDFPKFTETGYYQEHEERQRLAENPPTDAQELHEYRERLDLEAFANRAINDQADWLWLLLHMTNPITFREHEENTIPINLQERVKKLGIKPNPGSYIQAYPLIEAAPNQIIMAQFLINWRHGLMLWGSYESELKTYTFDDDDEDGPEYERLKDLKRNHLKIVE